MDKEKIEKVSEVVKNLSKNVNVKLESEHAKDVATKYITLNFIGDQIINIIWLPVALTIAYAVYAGATWLMAQI